MPTRFCRMSSAGWILSPRCHPGAAVVGHDWWVIWKAEEPDIVHVRYVGLGLGAAAGE